MGGLHVFVPTHFLTVSRLPLEWVTAAQSVYVVHS